MKAVIAEIRGKYVAALSEDGVIRQLKNKNYAVGQVVDMKVTAKSYSKLAVRTACAAAVVAITSVSAWAYYTPYSYVSLDVNPSIEYSINRFGRVLSCTAVNDDGEQILGELELKGKHINTAVEETVQALFDDGYLSDEEPGNIVIAASSENEDASSKLATEIKDSADTVAQQNALNVQIDAEGVSQRRMEEAKALGVTPGKLNLVQKLQTSDSGETINTEEWLDKPVKEIMKQIKENHKTDKQKSPNDGPEKGDTAIDTEAGSAALPGTSDTYAENGKGKNKNTNTDIDKSKVKNSDFEKAPSGNPNTSSQKADTVTSGEDVESDNNSVQEAKDNAPPKDKDPGNKHSTKTKSKK